MSAKIEELPESASGSDAGEEQPQVAEAQGEIPAGASIAVHSRAEKKARSMIAKLNLQPVPGITRIAFRRSRAGLFAINNPDVYKSPNSDSYVIFGEVKTEPLGDFGTQQQAAAAQQLAAQEEAAAPSSDADKVLNDTADKGKNKADAEEDDGEPVDATGVEPKDIELVQQQTSVSRNKAIKALKENNGDLVNAIMSLTM